jgi:hypothetical protein
VLPMAKPSKFESFVNLVVGVGAAFGLLTLVRRSWDTCGVKINDLGNGATLLFLGLPVALIVNIGLFGIVFRLSKGQGKFVVPFVTAAVAITIADLALFSWAGTPATLPSSLCPANVPTWWPEWIPT